MDRLSSLIRLDKEFFAAYDTLLSHLTKDEPRPCAVSGLCAGALRDFLIETVYSVAKTAKKWKNSCPWMKI